MVTLERLADRAGIEPFYYPIWGDRIVVSDETKIAILKSLGYPADTEAERLTSLQALEGEAWESMVEPATTPLPEARARTIWSEAREPIDSSTPPVGATRR